MANENQIKITQEYKKRKNEFVDFLALMIQKYCNKTLKKELTSNN